MHIAGRNDAPVDEALRILRGWKDLPKEAVLHAFEASHFAGVDEMRRNERLFDRVSPMAMNDIMVALQYRFVKPHRVGTKPIVTTFSLLTGKNASHS